MRGDKQDKEDFSNLNDDDAAAIYMEKKPHALDSVMFTGEKEIGLGGNFFSKSFCWTDVYFVGPLLALFWTCVDSAHGF